MMIRLGKGLLLSHQVTDSRSVIEELEKEHLDRRTYMHLLYLEAQVCLVEGNREKAHLVAIEERDIAMALHAQQDERRFQALIEKM